MVSHTWSNRRQYLTVTVGIQLTLYLSCAIFLWSDRRARSARFLFLLGYITVLILIATFFAAVQARTTEETYVDNRNFPGGPWQYFLSTEYLPINVMFYSTFIAGTFLADLLMVGVISYLLEFLVNEECLALAMLDNTQCIGQSVGLLHRILSSMHDSGILRSVFSFPPCAAILIYFLVMGIIWAIESTKPGLSLYNTLPLKYGTSYYVLSVSANVILTVLISVQLLIFRRRIMKLHSPELGKDYFSLLTIIVESAALYSAFGIIFIVTYALNNPLNQIFLFVANSSQVSGLINTSDTFLLQDY